MGVELRGVFLAAGGIIVGNPDHFHAGDGAQAADVGFGVVVGKTHDSDFHIISLWMGHG
jgi:hypothetical protein